MPMKPPARLAAACAAGGIAAGLLALGAPAAYADGGPAFHVSDDTVTLTPGSGTTTVENLWWLDSFGYTGTAENVVVTIDASAMPDSVGVAVDPFTPEDGSWTADGAVWTCALGDLDYNDGDNDWYWETPPRLRLTPGDTGARGELAVTVGADDIAAVTAVRGVVVGGAVAFDIGEAPETTAEPGDTVALPVTVTNSGDTTIYNPVLAMSFPGAAPASPGYANCGTSGDYDTTTYCVFPVALEPGETYELSAPPAIRIRDDVPAPSSPGSIVEWITHGEYAALHAEGTPGTGPALTVVGAEPAPADAPVQTRVADDPANRWMVHFLRITGENKGDLVPVTTALPARTGAATLTVGVRNDGPATFAWSPDTGESVTAVWFDLPADVTVGDLPDGCRDARPRDQYPADLACTVTGHFLNGQTRTFDIPVTVSAVDLTARGTVIAGRGHYGHEQTREADAANNTVAILFEGAEPGEPGDTPGPGDADGTGPGDGDTAGDPADDPNADTAADGTDDGSLPVTGTSLAVLAATGAALIAAGAVVFWRFRRRGAVTEPAE